MRRLAVIATLAVFLAGLAVGCGTSYGPGGNPNSTTKAQGAGEQKTNALAGQSSDYKLGLNICGNNSVAGLASQYHVKAVPALVAKAVTKGMTGKPLRDTTAGCLAALKGQSQK